jgi:hypothetical protein
MRAVGLDFLDSAPMKWTFEEHIAVPQDKIFAAVSDDPATWAEWFPGVSAGGYEGDGPFGVGTKRWVRVSGITYRETMLAWDAPSRWIFRVDHTPAPLAHALVEQYTVDPDGPNASVFRWTFALDPKSFFRITAPVGPRVLGTIFRRAARNLERRLG